MAICLLLQVISGFLSPFALKNILRCANLTYLTSTSKPRITCSYLENDQKPAFIKFWLWIVILFLGPACSSIFFQLYIFIGTRGLNRVQCVLTQLLFEHSLKIRFKAESSNTQPKTGEVLPLKKKSNLVGKINTLVAVDVTNVARAKDFLMIFWQVPLELVLGTLFLYSILGWRCVCSLKWSFYPLKQALKCFRGHRLYGCSSTCARLYLKQVATFREVYNGEGEVVSLMTYYRH